jgi:hypothetical protein
VIDQALDLIKRHDPIRYARLTRDLRRVVVCVLPNGTASFGRRLKVCNIDERFVTAHASQPEIVAAAIVHEATHARLMSCGIGYEEVLRSRVEAVCVRRERAFAARLPNGQLASEQAERSLTLAPEAFTDEAQVKLVYNNAAAAFNYLGTPWLIRAIALRAARPRLRQLARRSSSRRLQP